MTIVAHLQLSDPEQSQKELIDSWAGAKSSCRKLIFPTKIADVCGSGHGIVLIKGNNNNQTSTAIHSSVNKPFKREKIIKKALEMEEYLLKWNHVFHPDPSS